MIAILSISICDCENYKISIRKSNYIFIAISLLSQIYVGQVIIFFNQILIYEVFFKMIIIILSFLTFPYMKDHK